jgi:UDP-2,3-diacylglucosamine hydrolase
MPEISGTARFISDLHLRPERPDLVQRLATFLAGTVAANVESLFILGDLFEYWIGDDDLGDPFNAEVCDLLRSAADMGPSLYFIAGNRDFLIGPRFAAAARMVMLDDVVKVGAGDTAILLMHGDTVCTDDLPYQEFRRLVRGSEWQRQFLGRPLGERRAEVEILRRRSVAAMQGKTTEIMDANPAAIRAALMEHNCLRLIHGHTHRPGRDEFHLPAGRGERYVLSDWDTGRGDALEIGPAGVRRLDLSR